MRFTASKDTLAYHLQARPLTNAVDISDLPVSVFAASASAFLKKNPAVTPESDALFLYAGNHALSALRGRYALHEPMDQKDVELVREYFRRGNTAFSRMLFYCLVICFREARHLHDKHSMVQKLKAEGLGAAATIITSVEDNAHSAMNQFLALNSAVPVGLCARALSFVFYKGGWSSGYGGKKWGAIADATADVLHGKTTPEMFTDIGFALAHNGGPIFNKGMFYKSYTPELIKVLDVQRSGQIPALINGDHASMVSAEHKAFVAKMAHLGEEFTTKQIDWQKVEDLGAIGSYTGKPKAKKAKKSAPAGLHGSPAQAWSPAKPKHFVKEITIWANVGKEIVVEQITREGLKA